MKFGKMLLASALVASMAVTASFANYNKGFKYYKRFVKETAHIKGSDFVKLVGMNTPADVDALLKDNAKPLIDKLNKLGKKKAAKAIEKIVKKHKLKDLGDFLKGLVQGKIPAGC